MKSSLALLNFKCLRKALHNASLKRRKKLLHFRWWHLFMARMCSTLYLHILGNTIFSFFIILSLSHSLSHPLYKYFVHLVSTCSFRFLSFCLAAVMKYLGKSECDSPFIKFNEFLSCEKCMM